MERIKQALLILMNNPKRFINILLKKFFNKNDTGSYRYSTAKEISVLQKYAKKDKTGIVEIGTLDGGTIKEIALCANVPIYSIDPLIPDSMDEKLIGTKEKIYKNMNFYKKFIFIEDYSFNVAKYFNKKFDFIWIDGDHSYDGCKRDFLDWFPLLENDGFIIFHDSAPVVSEFSSHLGYEGPIRVVSELKNDNRLSFLECVDSITVFKKNA